MTGSLNTLVSDYFKKLGLSTTEVKSRVVEFETWNGVVDGCCRHGAILKLIEERDNWKGFSWQVNLLPGGGSLQRYKQLARVLNAIQTPTFFTQITLFDILKGLKEEWDRLLAERNGNRPRGQDVANAFDGSYHLSDSHILQAANTAYRLSMKVID